MENIPDTGPALIIYYHGAIPIDIYYFLAKTLFAKDRLVHTVADHFLFKVPGKIFFAEKYFVEKLNLIYTICDFIEQISLFKSFNQ